jgi:hypothetical protein
MTAPIPDPRLDRLYNLVPAIYRIRDAKQQYVLQALLRVIAEQVNVVQGNIAQLYDNWFIETAEDWAVPYIADLIGYRPAADAGLSSDGATAEGRALNRTLIPRREVANTIRYRRRKGTLAVLEALANDVANWPAHAVEFFKLLGWNQNIDHLHMRRARTADLRNMEALDLLGGPLDPLAHTVNVRRIDSHRTIGRHNIPSVGVFVWRLKPYSVTQTPAYCVEESGPQCYTFSVLGQDAPLFTQPESGPEQQTDRSYISEELSVPAPVRRYAFANHTDRFYGAGKSLAIWVDGWTNQDDQPVPLGDIVPADLSLWQYAPDPQKIAVDPVLGRIAFAPGHLPKKGVRVSYHYGFSADIGGGEYRRAILNPSRPGFKLYQVGKDPAFFHKIGDALQQWQKDNPTDAVIELTDSAVYVELISITLAEGQTLQLRAANARRPVIRMLDWQTDLPDALSVTMARGSRFTLDGLMITGRPVQITGPEREAGDTSPAPICSAHLVIRHCTLVPGWGIDCDCQPKRPAEPSLELFNVRAAVRIERSIVGAIQINENEVTTDPIPVYIRDSILDATDPQKEAVGAPGQAVAHAVLSIQRTTVFGIVNVRAIESADDSIFMGCLNVARRQIGCMRFCYVPPGCRTPRRYHCQPDLVAQAVIDAVPDPAAQAAMIASERIRLRPQFTSVRYGKPAYAQLGENCADEIKRGAEDESEMGAFHDLFQPQRAANLKARLDEYTPAGMDAGILFAN